MRLKWERRALKDLFAIYDYIKVHDPSAADRIALEIESAAQRLKQFPKLGHVTEHVGIRLLPVPGRPYALPYRLIGEFVHILAVFDQRRDPEDMV